MADYDVQVALHHTSNMPEDDCVNTLHYSMNFPDTFDSVSNDIALAYQGLFALRVGPTNGLTIRWYPPGPNPGGPAFTKKYTTGYISTLQAAPREVAVCLSYASVDNVDASTPRRRGRIYVGPISGNNTNSEDVFAGLRNDILTFGQALASAGSAGNTTWLLYSRTDNVYVKIESIWVDNAWDTQRRRGLKPTVRQTQDVQ